MTVAVEPGATLEALRRSPLADRRAELAAGATAWVRLAEEPFLSQVNLRVPRPAVARIARALDIAVPFQPNVGTENGGRAVLWLGPDEWLVVAPDGQAGEILAAARDALGGSPGSTVDVSANRTTLRLSGINARDVLESVCSLDLHPRSFSAGCCAQTLLGRTQAILWQVGAEPAYRLLVGCSFANYLADLLVDAMSTA